MKKINLKETAKCFKGILREHAPEILMGVGIAGMVTTTVLAVYATPKALEFIAAREEELNAPKLSIMDTVKVAWKPYIPCVITGVISIGCILGANSVNFRRNAALATAYKLSEAAFAEYKDAVVETIGEKKEELVQHKISENRLKQNPVSKNEVIVAGDGGATLCYDALSGRYFKSTIQKIEAARNKVNEQMLGDNYVSLNEFYERLNLEPTKIGDELGWNIFSDGLVEVRFDYQGAEDGTPCLVLDYNVSPRYGYYKMN